MKKKSKIKVVIIQPYNTPYRNELFNQINQYQDIELYLVYIDTKSEDRKWMDKLVSNFKEINVRCRTQKVSYERNNTRVNLFDFLKTIYKINPEVIISQLNKYTILLKYIFFYKKIKLIHWSESTLITTKGTNFYNKTYLKWHIDFPKAFLFPGQLTKNYLINCGFTLNNNNLFLAPNSVDDIFISKDDELKNKFSSANKLKFLFVGSFHKFKEF